MKFLKNNIWTISCLALFMVFGLAVEVFAQGMGARTLMETAQGKATTVFLQVKTIIFIVGGFGLVGLAFAAVFGKVDWKWFASLAVGLAILAAAGAIIEYATGTDTISDLSNEDSFGR